jgi:large subunit ribosomal protein L23
MLLDPTQIVIKPLVTEKSTWEADARNRYAFEVHPKANKPQIRAAVQALYKVRVTDVATQNRHGRYRRTRWGTFRTRNWKRAVVQLHPDDRIDLF